MLTIRGYAEKKNVSYEAIRSQVNRYRNDLQGHIIKQGRTQYLDDTAIAFLDEKRSRNPVVVVQTDKDERIEQLERENKSLLIRVNELQQALMQEKDEVKQLQADKIELLEKKEDAKPNEPDQEEHKHWWKFWK